MDPASLDRARGHFDDAKESLRRLVDACNIADQRRAWSRYLTDAQRVLSKLAAGSKAGRSSQWYGTIRHDQRKDELIRYVHQARHANEHGVSEIISKSGMEVKIGDFDLGPGYIDNFTVSELGKTSGRLYGSLAAIVKPAQLKLVSVTK